VVELKLTSAFCSREKMELKIVYRLLPSSRVLGNVVLKRREWNLTFYLIIKRDPIPYYRPNSPPIPALFSVLSSANQLSSAVSKHVVGKERAGNERHERNERGSIKRDPIHPLKPSCRRL
jgi:hypothetical protein